MHRLPDGIFSWVGKKNDLVAETCAARRDERAGFNGEKFNGNFIESKWKVFYIDAGFGAEGVNLKCIFIE